MRYLIVNTQTGKIVGTATKSLGGIYEWDSEKTSTTSNLDSLFKVAYGNKLREFLGHTYTYIPMTDLMEALE